MIEFAIIVWVTCAIVIAVIFMCWRALDRAEIKRREEWERKHPQTPRHKILMDELDDVFRR